MGPMTLKNPSIMNITTTPKQELIHTTAYKTLNKRLKESFNLILFIVLFLTLMSVLFAAFYKFCEYERKIKFNENIESSLDEMARTDARNQIKQKHLLKKMRRMQLQNATEQQTQQQIVKV